MAKFIKVNSDSCIHIINIDCITGLYNTDISYWLQTKDASIHLTKEEYDRISKILLETNND